LPIANVESPKYFVIKKLKNEMTFCEILWTPPRNFSRSFSSSSSSG